jgi:SulP family sulfate permease
MLTDMQKDLANRGITLQFAEIKGPVLDRLRNTPLGETMRDQIFLSTHEAFVAHTLQTSTAKKNTAPV